MIRYRLTLEPDDNGTILVTSPDIPIVTYGQTEADAHLKAEDAIQSVIESMMSARELVPIPALADQIGVSSLRLSLQSELKVSLHNAMVAADLTRAGLMRKLDWSRESIDRLFRLDHNSRLDQIEGAFKALGKAINVDVREAV